MTGFSKKKIRIDLATARTNRGDKYTVAGRKVIVTGASSANALAQLSMIGDFTADPVDMVLQAKVGAGRGFDGFYITNTTQAGEWLELSVTDGDGDFEYDRPISNSISSITAPVVTVGGSSAAFGAAVVGTAAGKIIDADPNGTGWIVHNNGSAIM